MRIFNTKHIRSSHQKGFVLPTVLVLSIVLLTLGLSVFQLTSTIARSLTDQYWQKVARQAAQAGTSYMSACVDQGLSSSTWPTSITQNDTCLGIPLSTPQPSIFTNTTDTNPVPNPYRSSFTIYKPTLGADGIPKARVVGTVSILNTAGTTTIRSYTYEMVSLINGPSRASTKVSAGAFHTCSLADSQVYCWGKNTNGELGLNNTTTPYTTPQYVSTNLNNKIVTSISAGGALDGTSGQPNTCAVANGQAYCWGENANGQLGIGNTTRQLTPTLTTQAAGALGDGSETSVSTGRYSGCAIANGKASCWGYFPYNTSSNNPLAISTAIMSGPVTQISAGHSYSCAIADSKVYCWGYNASGQIGSGNTTNQSNPYETSSSANLTGKAATSIEVGTSTTCAIANGQLYCWGLNANGQLGINNTTNQNTPQNVSTVATSLLIGKNVTDVSIGGSFVCAIANGQLYCWGENDVGQLGIGNTTQQQLPQLVGSSGILNGKVISDVDAGGDHVCAVSQGDTYCWGLNGNGQLGDGTTTNRSSPVKSLNSF